ncbi:MAG: hypothetical protein PHS07_01195 [Patescibacteria group bacterium]|nr:hypothetical protein [Patescibacteria group bacterium]
MAKQKNNKKAWVVTVDMGYGHRRASYPLKNLAYKNIIDANNYHGIPREDKQVWADQRKFYETISRFKKVPILGDVAFEIFDQFQRIPDFYPKRDLSKPSLQVKGAMKIIKNKNWGKHLIEKVLGQNSVLPLITTFFIPAYMAEYFNYPGEIYCVICDADISRAWVAVDPRKSKIKYLAPCQRVVERLQLYGVPKERIILTGFPLPIENLGSQAFGVSKLDMRQRLINLDPQRNYINKYKDTLQNSLKIKNFPKKSNHLLTLTFAVGGAGAQRELADKILEKLKEPILHKKLRVNLIAGVHKPVKAYFQNSINRHGLKKCQDKGVRILFEDDKQEYMKKFNQWLRTTDVLWTKPSELSFYVALGLPIIIAPPIGSQEDFNKTFLIDLGAGLEQLDMDYVDEWFFDWINSGRLAEAAAQGFLEAPKMGTYNIQTVVQHQGQIKEFKGTSPY